jgi:hypothetical protein
LTNGGRTKARVDRKALLLAEMDPATLRKLADATGCPTENDAIRWLARRKQALFENVGGQLSLTVKALLLLDNTRRF